MNWHDCTPAEQDALIDAYILANRALTISYLEPIARDGYGAPLYAHQLGDEDLRDPHTD